MHTSLAVERRELELPAISPLRELGAYEALWDQPGASFKSIADLFRKHPQSVPSDLVPEDIATTYANRALEILERAGIKDFGIRVHGAGEYPPKLRDAAHPVELLYFRGWWDLVETASVAVVGTRNPSPDGEARARRLVRNLVQDGFTIVSGLARGIDTVAHRTAIEHDGWTIGVIGTSIAAAYPKENAALQELIAEKYLLVSQVPLCRYAKQSPATNRLFFPERNVTMSALTSATIIVEAGETSGTLIQARAALQQGRKLFILDSCFRNPHLTWPQKFADMGAIRVQEYEDIRRHLVSEQAHGNRRPDAKGPLLS